jgi:hypothetical protein
LKPLAAVPAKEIILKRKYLGTAFISLVCSFATGCSSQQAYNIGQEYQRNQCLHIPDKAESDRCLSKTDTSYDDYKQEKDATK